ncbi:putative glutathione S-transferase [Aspergillus sclerotioniger CBS 115572]|uniref:glutathione transferase n=1 Tax=Aspergillus sclerotioniger CBS 115572 TaxID=1450535 RepID=A0A317WS08_9EURO|nr:putative glutathione S-transferase [Aspergillus sclerotioniger CBS 115572]PWY88815.1 putative glutathione S-transferase [Aspergillus sclerotioniger CBS 115572]
MLTIHHLERSQSERIIWLCEELHLPYELKVYKRSPLLAPPELQALHPSRSAPIIQDGPVTLSESGAIFEYILTKHNPTHALTLPPTHPSYANYLYFLHFANGTFQPALLRYGLVIKNNLHLQEEGGGRFSAQLAIRGFERALRILDERVRGNTWLAGEEFTAADVMMGFSLTTMRGWVEFGLEGWEGIKGYLGRVGEREGFRRMRIYTASGEL